MTIVLMLAAAPSQALQASSIPVTRTASASAALPSWATPREGQLARGQLARAITGGKLTSAPARSVVQISGHDHVFRRTPDGFAPTPVEVVGRTEEVATLRGGLQPEAAARQA